jgi:hypothetical protein
MLKTPARPNEDPLRRALQEGAEAAVAASELGHDETPKRRATSPASRSASTKWLALMRATLEAVKEREGGSGGGPSGSRH